MKALLLFAVVAVLLSGCDSSEKTTGTTVFKNPGAQAQITDNSVYNLAGEWKDQTGQTIFLKDLAGKPRVVTMFYSTCRFACPKTIADMKTIQSGLTDGENAELSYVLFSFDPVRDTPERLDTVARDMDLSCPQWKLLTSDESTAHELAAATNIQYKDMTTGEFSHSNTILILNKNGEIVHRQEGLGSDPKASIEVLKKLIAEN